VHTFLKSNINFLPEIRLTKYELSYKVVVQVDICISMDISDGYMVP
jgi:hypothetical protein